MDPVRQRRRGDCAGCGRVMGAAHRRSRNDEARGLASARYRGGRRRLSGDRTGRARLGAAGGQIAQEQNCGRHFLAEWRDPAAGRCPSPAGARRRAAQHRQRWTDSLLRRLDRARHGRRAARRRRLPHAGGFFRLCAGIRDTDRNQLPRLRGLGMSAKWPGRRPARHVEGARRFRCLRMGAAFGRTLSCADRDRAASLR